MTSPPHGGADRNIDVAYDGLAVEGRRGQGAARRGRSASRQSRLRCHGRVFAVRSAGAIRGLGQGYWEAPLRAVVDPNRVGASLQNKSLRPLSDADFAAIVAAGLQETLAPENARRLDLVGVEEAAAPFDYGAAPGLEHVRRVEQMLVNRIWRPTSKRRS
jgi:hypothetical protein